MKAQYLERTSRLLLVPGSHWLLVLAAALACALVFASPAAAAPYTTGDVFVSDGQTQVNQVQEFTPTGTLIQTLQDTNTSLGTAGSAFDASGNFYVTDFSNQTVSKFDATGAFVGPFGSGYSADPESILFDNTGNAYVGQADGSHQILKFNSAGNPVASYSPATESRGTDWIDLASDQCTMHYTSEGVSVKSYNVCTNTQNADFATGLPGPNAFAHRILSDGGELVADTDRVVRLDSSGNVVQTYLLGNPNVLFALNLDPNGTSFWTAELDTSGQVFKVNIASGAIEEQWTGNTGGVSGLSILGEITQGSLSTCTITINKNSNPAGGTGFGFHSLLPALDNITLNNSGSITKTVPCGFNLSVYETPMSGWTLTDITCAFTNTGLTGSFNILPADFSNSTPGFQAGDNAVGFALFTGAHLNCTFTNTLPICTASNGANISTGTGSIGSPDPKWSVDSGNAYRADPRNAEPPLLIAPNSWVTPPPGGSHWIHATNTAELDSQPLGPFVYKTQFAVPNGVVGLVLNFQFATDNEVSFTLIGPAGSGYSAPIFPVLVGTASPNFHTLRPATPTIITPLANPSNGIYTLQATVTNPDAPTPSGLLVAGTVSCGVPIGGAVALSVTNDGSPLPLAAVAAGVMAVLAVGLWYGRRRWLR
jgi:hypothetical protein